MVTGTNGKTTTSALIAHFLREEGFSVTANRSGANLLSGVLTTLLLRTNIFGRVIDDFAVLEVDELNFDLVLKHLKPRTIVFTGLSRDQLDRYGEIDSILERWSVALSDYIGSCKGSLGEDLSTLVINTDSPHLEKIMSSYEGPVLRFDGSDDYLKLSPLSGTFNSYNVNAAALAVKSVGVSERSIETSLPNFKPVFGRGEKVYFDGKELDLFLAKNPASFNNNVEMLNQSNTLYDSLLIILNDGIPDGRDVSWIYDIDSYKLRQVCMGKNIYVAGTRHLDMEIRLGYAGIIEVINTDHTSMEELERVAGSKVAVLPNYSAMLEFRECLLGRNIL